MSSSSSTTTSTSPILVTGAAGRVGGVGRMIVENLLSRGFPVRAVVRQEDERSESLKLLGAEICVADLTNTVDVVRAVSGISRVYFGMAVSQPYLEASVIMAAALKQNQQNIQVLVNMSQMTVSSMDLQRQTTSPQQRQHWLAEQTLNWSGLPVVHIRPTVFLEHPFFSPWAADSIARDGTIQLPFGNARTSPIAVSDIASVVATILTSSLPSQYTGKVYELTGPKSQTMYDIALEYSSALNRDVKYIPVDFDEWDKNILKAANLPSHVYDHIHTMAYLHSQNAYDRIADGVQQITGKQPTTIKQYIETNPEKFNKAKKQTQTSSK